MGLGSLDEGPVGQAVLGVHPVLGLVEDR